MRACVLCTTRPRASASGRMRQQALAAPLANHSHHARAPAPTRPCSKTADGKVELDTCGEGGVDALALQPAEAKADVRSMLSAWCPTSD